MTVPENIHIHPISYFNIPPPLSLSLPPFSERDAGQSAFHPSLGEVSQPLSDQPGQPEPSPSKSRIKKAETGCLAHAHG